MPREIVEIKYEVIPEPTKWEKVGNILMCALFALSLTSGTIIMGFIFGNLINCK